ncbi:molybdenum ABC transporter ATP-binding protein [Paracoccus fistulariae]|uniref:Molybdenum ABC transporter ATP-binding protein n=1 Tax=Paracoccus fistulariae TaxID=658446 RepID=A0ABY7SR75_9RHOB|nr:molybdenum ABC transporter ATP-binding protein [Paracoccus fistulariae]MDB6179857.1 molybdenum ABC transporter ATP-binding protein [Paracoccus fistulariae]WCR08952.1 molybdenum ABC transporter ATP-binding protein [Paracoccus fistulariae]
MMLSVDLQHHMPGFDLDLTFTAPAGVTALFGPSGSGKTTIINAIAGLTSPQSGRIEADGQVFFDSARGVNLPPHRRQLGYLFQDARLFPHLTVRQNLLYGSWFARKRPARAEFGQIVEMLGIGHLLTRRPAGLSGGERQRVAFGRAILSRPRMLLMDEPLAALDEARKAEILPYLERLRDETGLPILYVTHSVSELARMATTVVMLDQGRIAASGPADQIFADPATAPLLGIREAGSILNARVVSTDGDGLSRLQSGAGPLWLSQPGLVPGRDLRVRIMARDVMLSLQAPEGISALNIIPARVESLTQTGRDILVRLEAGPETILSQITRRSAQLLDLRPGMPVHAVLKTLSVAPGSVAQSLSSAAQTPEARE